MVWYNQFTDTFPITASLKITAWLNWYILCNDTFTHSLYKILKTCVYKKQNKPRTLTFNIKMWRDKSKLTRSIFCVDDRSDD